MEIPASDILSADACREAAAWYEASRETLPASVRALFEIQLPWLLAGEGAPRRRALDTSWRELRRALRITPSSEKRRTSGSPLAGVPLGRVKAESEQERIEAEIARSNRLAGWHKTLKERHHGRARNLKKRLATMPKKIDDETNPEGPIPLEETELTAVERAEAKAAGDQFVEHLLLGGGADPALKSVTETLMPVGSVLVHEKRVKLPAVLPEDLVGAKVVKTLTDNRERYEFSFTLERIELAVEKKVVVDTDGERYVIAPSTRAWGPPRHRLTWNALASLAILAGQFAMPLNRLGTLLSTPKKRFGAGALSRALRYVAKRFVAVYLQLGEQLADSDYLAGDDTPCRVLQVSSYFAKQQAVPGAAPPEKPPWSSYRTPSDAEGSIRECQKVRRERRRRRADGDREATRTREETPSLGVLIGRRFPFASPRRDGKGTKGSMNTTVVTGRSEADDPKSLIIFYRSHLGGCANLVESLLESRSGEKRDLVVQGDLATTNLVTREDLLQRFRVRTIGCSAHGRRPFALYQDYDVERCDYMLHLFAGLAIHERQLDALGRNRENVLAVRGSESRELWNDILELAKDLTEVWAKDTHLGRGARYIINHFDALTAYLDDPRLEPTNSLRERMLRTEKLIESSSLFRTSLEGRFVLDVLRTILQTAVAAGAPVHEYLVSVLRTNPKDVAAHPERFTPRAWVAGTPPPASPPAP